MATELRGILCAMSTPFTADYRLDEAGLRELVDGLIAAGIHGLIPLGSTGEFPTLSVEERQQVAEIVVDQAKGRVPVVIQTGATSTALAIELSRHAEGIGADGVMVVQPFYEPMTLDEIYGYFRDISAAIKVPIMVYNIPSCTGMNLTPAFVARMGREIENVKYVKDSSGDLSQFSELLYKYGADIIALNGWDTITFAGLSLGSKGGVWGAGNLMPRQCAELFNLVAAGKLNEARSLWDRMWPVLDFIGSEGYNAGVKAGANLIGFHVGNPRPPYRALSPEKTQILKGLLIRAGALAETARA